MRSLLLEAHTIESLGAAMVISTLWPVKRLGGDHRRRGDPLAPGGGIVAVGCVGAGDRDGQGPSGIPAELRPLLDEALTSTWQDQLETTKQHARRCMTG